MSKGKKVLGTSDPKTDAKFKQEKGSWNDLIEVRDCVVGQLGIQLDVCLQMGKQNKDFFNKDKEAGLLLTGITKSLRDASIDIKKLNDRLSPKVFTDETETVKLDKKKLVVKPKEELEYMSLYIGYTDNGETIGKIGLDIMLNLSTKLNCNDIAKEVVELSENFDKAANAIENQTTNIGE